MKKIMFIALALLMAACEKPILNEDYSKENKEANVILHMSPYVQESFTRAAQDITDLCTRLNIAIFDTDGTKVKTVAKKSVLSSFGRKDAPGKKWRPPTLPHCIAVPSAQAGLTSLFGMGRGGTPPQ